MILVMRLQESHGTGRPRTLGDGRQLRPIRGWLLVYQIALIPFALHGSLLTIGSVLVYAHSSANGHSHVPLASLVYYLATNVALILYVIYLFILMSRRRKSAIINNIVFNALSVAFLVSWHLIGEKSTTGMIADSAPNLVFAVYFLASRRVRQTFVVGRAASQPVDSDLHGYLDAAPD